MFSFTRSQFAQLNNEKLTGKKIEVKAFECSASNSHKYIAFKFLTKLAAKEIHRLQCQTPVNVLSTIRISTYVKFNTAF